MSLLWTEKIINNRSKRSNYKKHCKSAFLPTFSTTYRELKIKPCQVVHKFFFFAALRSIFYNYFYLYILVWNIWNILWNIINFIYATFASLMVQDSQRRFGSAQIYIHTSYRLTRDILDYIYKILFLNDIFGKVALWMLI